MAKKRRSKSKSMRELLMVHPGSRPRLGAALAKATPGIADRAAALGALASNLAKLEELQYKLFADGKCGVLVVLQAIDGGGKDSTIRHVFGAFNPQGCKVTAFKVPSSEELRHDYLWRIHKAVPGRGEIGVFNRSHYEDVLVVRVHELVPRDVWSRRYAQINEFESLLAAGGIRVVKLLLHISKDEQRERFLERLKEPSKRWKFNPQDLQERKRWRSYMQAFEDALERCSTEHAPWYVIPANRKWYRDYAVSQILVETLSELPLRWPQPDYDPAKIRIT